MLGVVLVMPVLTPVTSKVIVYPSSPVIEIVESKATFKGVATGLDITNVFELLLSKLKVLGEIVNVAALAKLVNKINDIKLKLNKLNNFAFICSHFSVTKVYKYLYS